MANGRDTNATLAEVEKSFAARNHDKSLIDWQSIDGDGKRPTNWDFRREAFLRFNRSA